jgi:hypothetical protein
MAKVQVVTLGADPEFELIVDGAIVSASSVLRADIHLPWGSIGVDGAGSPLELRPKPSTKPSILVKNVGRLLLAVPKAIGGVPSTACEYYSIGGHIHIGNLPRNTSYDNLVEAVDDGLGDIFYDLNTRVRINAGYGKREEWRPQPWGVEYRTPPAAIWSHPEVAFTFTEAIRWMVDKLLAGENPLRSDEWASIRSAAQQAADFARRYNGRLHWGAWKAILNEIDYTPYLGVKVHYDSGERDKTFLRDIHAMCARLGLASLRIVSLRQSRGDYASNVPGYGTLVDGFSTFTPGGTLCLSWRFRNDPEFRKAELPKLEAAIAEILRNSSEVNDGGRLVKEVVHLLPAGLPSEDGEEEPGPEPVEMPHDEDGDDEVAHQRHRSAPREGYTWCRECGRETRRDLARITENGDGPFCGDCYWRLYQWCTHCGREVPTEAGYRTERGRAYCERCRTHLVACAGCGEEVHRERATQRNNDFYCAACFFRLFAMCGRCGEYHPCGDVSYVSAQGRMVCRYCREEGSIQEDDVPRR